MGYFPCGPGGDQYTNLRHEGLFLPLSAAVVDSLLLVFKKAVRDALGEPREGDSGEALESILARMERPQGAERAALR